MTEVWARDDLESSDKFVLLALADNANDERVCWPSIETIAKKTSLSERAVHYAIKRLEEEQFLIITRRRGSSNMFFLGGARDAPLQGLHPSPAISAPRGVQPVHLGGAMGAPRTIMESSSEPSMNPREIFRMLLKTGGKEPKRTERIQKAIDKVGGWVKIRNCTDYDIPYAEKAFADAYTS